MATPQELGWFAVRGADLCFIPSCSLLSFPPLGILLEYFQAKLSFRLSESKVSFFSFHQEELGPSPLEQELTVEYLVKEPQYAEQRKRTDIQLLLRLFGTKKIRGAHHNVRSFHEENGLDEGRKLPFVLFFCGIRIQARVSVYKAGIKCQPFNHFT